MPRLLGRMLVGGLGAWNVVVNRHLPPSGYVPANLAVAAATYSIGRAAGASNRQLGISRGSYGVAVGLIGAAIVGTAAVVASRLEPTRHLFDDARAQERSVPYETLWRIPLGTVLLEEIGFRAVLPALLDGGDRRRVSVTSAALFGLWHILPTLNTLDINNVTNRRTRFEAVVGGVAATAGVAVLLDELRLRSESLLTPILIHWSANAVSYAIAARR